VLRSLQIGDAIVLKAADIGLYNFARFTRLRLVTQTCGGSAQVCVTSLRRAKNGRSYIGQYLPPSRQSRLLFATILALPLLVVVVVVMVAVVIVQ